MGNYVFNVVARSLATGHSTAYAPYRSFIFGDNVEGQFEQASRSILWERAVPLLLIFALSAFIAWSRPCCKGQEIIRRHFDLELPHWGRSARQYNVMVDNIGNRRNNVGSYAPPSMVGQTY